MHRHKNGKSTQAHHHASAALAAGGDPMDRIAAMGSGGSTMVAIAVAGAIVFHAGVAAAGGAAVMFRDFISWQRDMKGLVADKLAQTYDIEPDKPKDEPPPKPEEKEEEKPQPTAQPQPQNKDEPPPPPPEAAKAGAVLAQAPDPNDPVDLTGNTFVTGTGDSYAGGVTQAQAKGGPTYQRNAVAEGKPGGTGTGTVAPPPPPPPQPTVDRSRPPRLTGGDKWDCPFPSEAESDDVNEAYVMIKATVGADGKPQSVVVVSDPGHGFGREAKACALRKRWEAGLDRDGNATTATAQLKIRFTR